jgi:hypothetical protein
MPQLGNAAFAITCNNAAPNTVGLIAFAGAGLSSPMTVARLRCVDRSHVPADHRNGVQQPDRCR